MVFLSFLAVASFLLHTALACTARDHPDRVDRLPGFDQPLPSDWFSGYLTYDFAGQTIHTHYVLVLAEEEEEPDENKPLIYWTNGGPGASSLFGLMTELGPLQFSDDSLLTDDYRETGIPTPLYNKNTWSRLGSLLIFDQPAPIGFSYCNDDVEGHACGDLSWTDESAAENTYMALRAFYEKFPCFHHKDLYLTGESYGGIYVPTFAREILQGDDKKIASKLRGFAVGDGCLGTETGICSDLGGDHSMIWQAYFLFGHGQIPQQSFHRYMKACIRHDHPFEPAAAAAHNLRSSECQKVIAEIQNQVGGMYEYNLYDDCTYRNGILQLGHGGSGGNNDYACGGDLILEEYLSLPVVQSALHVEDNYFSVDNAENFDYTPTEKDLRVFYRDLAMDPSSDVRMLVYNGDADPAITSMAAQNWTSNLGLEETQGWRPWTVDSCRRMGGYVTQYNGGLDFLTIRGAGHMVPTYKSDATFAFISAWIKDADYPPYVKDCKKPSRGGWKYRKGGKDTVETSDA